MTDWSASAHLGNYDPSSFGWPRTVDLVPFAFQGTNFGECARAAVPVFTAVLTELVPHIPGGINFGPHDDWAYSATDDLPDGSWSFHHYGIAFDLNWDENPMGTYVTNPDAGQQGAIPHAAAHEIATKYGCEYGGDWSGGEGHRGFKDYMHFEIHLSPADARRVQPPVTDPLEEIMSWYASKADFEQAVADAVLNTKVTAKDGTTATVAHFIAQGEIHSRDADKQTQPAQPTAKGGH